MLPQLASLLWILGLALQVYGNKTPQAPLTDDAYTCTHPPYQVHIFSKSPLVIYITNFITTEERAHLLDITSVPNSIHTFPRLTSFLPGPAHSPPPSPPPVPANRASTTRAHLNLPVYTAHLSYAALKLAPYVSKVSISPGHTSSRSSSCPTRRSRLSTTTPTGFHSRQSRQMQAGTGHRRSLRTCRRAI
jgi:hypothetical protein